MSINEVIQRTSGKDTVYVINFWATWCAPCVAELPVFNNIHEQYKNQAVKVLLVSLDFKEDRNIKLPTFILRSHTLPDVIWLSDTNPNVFVPKVDEHWEGSIPATVVVATGTGYKQFVEGQVTEKQLRSMISKAQKH